MELTCKDILNLMKLNTNPLLALGKNGPLVSKMMVGHAFITLTLKDIFQLTAQAHHSL